ncbi:MAG: hypothetical protein WC045_02915 [Patescibacteria group bacterium]
MKNWHKIVLATGLLLFTVKGFIPWYLNDQAKQRALLKKESVCKVTGGYGVTQPDGWIKDFYICSDGSTRFHRLVSPEEQKEAERKTSPQPTPVKKHKKKGKKKPGAKKKTTPKEDKKPNKPTPQKNNGSTPVKLGAAWSQNNMIKHAWTMSGGNVAFITTLEAESGWSPTRIGHNTNGTTDHGLCQLNSAFHDKFIKGKSFKYWDQQLNYCWGVYKDAVARGIITHTFYGYNRRHEVENRFAWAR